MSEKRTYTRFELGQRIEHVLLIISFTTLCLTGLPQKYAGSGWSELLIAAMGGIENVRVIHRIAATLFILETVYHLVVMGYKLFVQRLGPSMLPNLKDARDAFQAIKYNLGLARERPQMGRYTFDEKVEYWALIWGLVVMVLTGFLLWNPIASLKVLPGQFIPAAKAAHGGEALLAFLAILVWHTYHVHLKMFNKSMWTGKMTEEQMAHEHPLELQAIEAGSAPRPAGRLVEARRRKVYLPIAAIFSVAAIAAVIYVVTFEQTAITTVPPSETLPILATMPPTATSVVLATATSAPVAGGQATAAPTGPETWEATIGPLFQVKCGTCHGAAAAGGLNVSTYASLMKGGAGGAVIAAGAPDNSSLLQVQASGTHPGQFSPDELARVRAWITAGAKEK